VAARPVTTKQEVSMDSKTGASFAARGGWWVVGQAPVLFAAVALPWWTRAGRVDLHQAWQWLGLSLAAVGGLLTLSGLVTLGDALTPFPRPLTDTRLRRNGVYRLVRHPVYSGLILGTAGWTLWCQSLAGIAAVIATVVFFDLKASREERWLREKYADYADYAARVKKFFPWVY
jgi:protein-S-isoprenylcysteine O-methyltransferase Ste14